ncbi:gamma-glutamyl-gamma-aminobutyrate hydrolase family protein [Brevibacillus agri]|uniref:gamma-glutamyl-gamma-aminobutyrate hydrolase family protein n=1 Tax=Brevibacillus agri TaxID=51101 RepID=UPI002E1A9137|nr:gamma-glutamyl-gamma-aminobutyrate hydrolase family protein [Brevibacillus agri]MED1645194.1 gamma-glutamyl-gamma-aminobutyrate hydrolase family protein [Brevibacillus agri]MED1657654.1 gamma-glutamyl-gamma-aminobutyrate hydrolase family protein [Brevibacillus agri]MED1689736.1 gamma-glutamyl-gamma-aminobutyrate hydrolase family protein [Brevibacillus agri]MED1693802.1 gamma-glutamyl-gamma-aminobutyrate hydrolase family protein [Brevibacillus agri]MED1699312.1 gamma-glutamyl-gamma-aminobuty
MDNPHEGFGGKLRGVAGQGFSVIGHDYLDAVRKAGAIPLGIPVWDLDACQELVAAVDGIVLAGGEDIDPVRYGARIDMRCSALAPERDEYELKLLEAALAANTG